VYPALKVLRALLYCSPVVRYLCRFTSSSAVHNPSPSTTPCPIPWDSSSQIHRLIFLYLFFTYCLSIPCLITPILWSLLRKHCSFSAR
jgi:hypothetical protein